MEDFIKALKQGVGYDYLANNYYKMSKEELKRIGLELLYELTSESHTPDIENVIEELEDHVNNY